MADDLRSTVLRDPGPSIVPIQPHGPGAALFCLLRGTSLVALRHFSPVVGVDQPIYGIWYPAMHGSARLAGSIEEIATACVAVIRQTQPEGPYLLFGHSLGGLVMYDVARQLTEQGEVVGLLAMADSAHPRFVAPEWRRRLFHLRRRVRKLFSPGRGGGPRDAILVGSDIPLDLTAVLARERDYRPARAEWPVAIFSTKQWRDYAAGPDLGWEPLLREWTSDFVPGSHDTMIGEPHVHIVAAKLAERLCALRLSQP
jgi:thioesterase domain-containing protein